LQLKLEVNLEGGVQVVQGRANASKFHEVGTSRCDVPARVQRAEQMREKVRSRSSPCAAERGADGAARHPYREKERP